MCSDGDTGAEGDGWRDNGGDMVAFITEIGEAIGFHNLRAYSIRDLETAGAKSVGQMETEQSLSLASLSLSLSLYSPTSHTQSFSTDIEGFSHCFDLATFRPYAYFIVNQPNLIQRLLVLRSFGIEDENGYKSVEGNLIS
ncbi:unnamed protein product [Protopolystoma xenopodis]|uniref:Uncharacterized protein n=1 Tax=Protopolystoma xenopodis TaxID=117903 RepID=A0A3S5AUT0_9PLAT|nr:unnamed protein product [Protopolystoma xenopodis]